MQQMHVNPTRMEMKRLSNRLKIATRGHKLLKDKTDEMVRRFIELAFENKRRRIEIESRLIKALNTFSIASGMADSKVIGEALLIPAVTTSLECSKHSLMNVSVPSISLSKSEGENYPYSFLTVPEPLDDAINTVSRIIEELVQLAQVEKTCNLLADEIEKNKRRVNALENMMIPNMKQTIRLIKMRLDENERASIVRLMKVKEIIQKKG